MFLVGKKSRSVDYPIQGQKKVKQDHSYLNVACSTVCLVIPYLCYQEVWGANLRCNSGR